MMTRTHATFALLGGALSSPVMYHNAFFIAVVKGDENVVVQDKVSRARFNRRDGTTRRQLGDSDGIFKELNAMDAMSGVRKAKDRKEKDNDSGNNPFGEKSFEVWASDQSNSVKGVGSPGVEGSFLWIWDSNEIAKLVTTGKEAKPMGCPGKADPTIGPCDVYDVFPKDLVDASGKTLGASDNFGRLHGMLTDPSNRYVTANMFAPNGGYVGIIDTKTRAAIGLFRITKFRHSAGTTRSNHMSYFSEDGKSIIIANLNGKAMERIDITRNKDGTIKKLVFNKSASLGLGKGMSVDEDATFFTGKNSINEDLLGGVKGTYDTVNGLGDLTPNGKCKENGCPNHDDGEMGGRPNNLIICPIATRAGLGYITLAGGGLLVADIASNPMKIVGEYGQGIVYGAGCGGVQTADDQVFLNAGISASSAGSTQSMFALYSFNDNLFPTGGGSAFNPENTPMPELVYQDTTTNTQTGGNVEGSGVANNSGQLPFVTDRRDSHGAEVTLDSKYVHVTDRIQNVVEVFDTQTYERTTYDLTSKSGQAGRDGPAGPCWKRSVMDDAKLPRNDPAPDLMSIEPNGKYLMIAFRGPYPVSVNHSAQGSCPGVGIVELLDNGKSGRLVEVLRTTNIVDNVPFVAGASAPGGHDYTGAERSDIHGAVVIARED